MTVHIKDREEKKTPSELLNIFPWSCLDYVDVARLEEFCERKRTWWNMSSGNIFPNALLKLLEGTLYISIILCLYKC